MLKWTGGDGVEEDMFNNPIMGVPTRLHQKWMDDSTFYCLQPGDEDALRQLVDKAIEQGYVGADTETSGLDFREYDGKTNDHLVGVCLAVNINEGFYIPVGHNDPKTNLDVEFVASELRRMQEAGVVFIWWNAGFDNEVMRSIGVDMDEAESFEDAQVAWFLSDCVKNKNFQGLKRVSEAFLGKRMIDLKDLFIAEQKDKNFATLAPSEGFIYAASDAMITLELWLKLKDHKIFKMQPLIYTIEKKTITAVRWMERNQFKVDVEYLEGLRDDVLTKQEEIAGKLYKLCGGEFNINSNDQLGRILAEKFNIPLNRTPSGQYATGRDELEELDKKHEGKFPALKLIVSHRKYEKVLGTYIKPLLENRDDLDQVRFNFKPLGADTGRFSSASKKIKGKDGKLIDSGVNGQNIPSVEKSIVNIRKGFIARPGFVLAAIDYSGVELRIAANLSGCKAWIDEFVNGTGDLHTLTARDAYKVPKDTPVDSKLRKTAKAINFGLLYGGGANTIAETAGIPKEEGFRLMKNFFSGVPELDKWLKRMKTNAKKKGYVQSAFGRVFLLPDARSDDRRIASSAERKSVNSPIQGSSADITKMAMCKTFKVVKENNWCDDCRLLMTVHDELVFEVRETMLVEILTALCGAMRACTNPSWAVPLEVDCEWNYNWGEVHYHGKHGWDYEQAKKKAEKAGETVPEKPPELLEVEALLASLNDAEAPPAAPEKAETLKEKKVEQEEKPTKIEATPVPSSAKAVTATPKPAAPAAEVPTVKFLVNQPFTKWKWRRLEAIFVLTSAEIYTTGNCRLQLVDVRGRDILGERPVYVNKMAFYFEAVRQGLIAAVA